MGYALFTPRYLANLHDRLRIYPVKAGLNDHCGMFFLGKDKKIICDDLTISPYTLKTLRSLCDLLQAISRKLKMMRKLMKISKFLF